MEKESYILLLNGDLHVSGRFENGRVIDDNCQQYYYEAKNEIVKIGGLNNGFKLYSNHDFNIDFNHYDTSDVVDMSQMFLGCMTLTYLDLSNFKTTNVTDMSRMFFACFQLANLNVSNFDTSNVTNMKEMFYTANFLIKLDLSSFDTSKVTNMERIFANCISLRYLDVSNFDVSNVTEMKEAFFNTSNLKYIKCKQSFKDWCISNQDTIDLPTQMREGGSGTWDIISE